MAYMSYCRFEGTEYELKRCIEDVMKHVYVVAAEPISENEINHFRRLVHDFYKFMEDLELIDYDNRCLDEHALDDVCFDMETYSDEEEGEDDDY